eukprot:10606588-Karenia_brevis.AAC.1
MNEKIAHGSSYFLPLQSGGYELQLTFHYSNTNADNISPLAMTMVCGNLWHEEHKKEQALFLHG